MTRKLRLVTAWLGLALAAGIAAAVIWQARGPAWLMPLVAAQIEAATHLRMATGGPVEVRLLPAPGLRAGDVRLFPIEAGAPPLVLADSLDVEFGWPGFLGLKPAIDTVRFMGAHLLAAQLHSAVDIVAALRPSGIDVTLSAPGLSARIAAHPDGGTLVLDEVVLGSGSLTFKGGGRFFVHDPIRLVLTTRGSRGDMPLGAVALAASYSTDGLVLERAEWQPPGDAELSLFGHAAIDGTGVRFEGGIGASLGAAGPAGDLSARFDGAWGRAGLNLSVDDIDLRAGGSHLTGLAKYAAGGPPKLSAELRLDRLDLPAAPLARAPFDVLAASLAEAVFAADAELRLRLGQVTVKGAAVADGVVVDVARHGAMVELRELAARAVAGAPLRASGRIAMSPGPRLAIDPMTVAYGAATAAGRAEVDVSAVPPRLILDMTTDALALDGLFAGPPPLPPEPVTRRAAAASAAAARQGAATAVAWSQAPLRVPALPPVDAELRLGAARLIWHGYRLQDAKVSLRLAETQVALERLTGSLFGGRLDASGVLEPGAQPRVAGHVELSGADLAAVLSELADTRNIAGRGSVAADLKASGSSAAELVASLAGTVTLQARDGAVTGVDLPALAVHLKQSARPTDLITVGRLVAGGRTPFASLSGRFQLDRGIARTDSLVLNAGAAIARSRGDIDLLHWRLDLSNEFQLSEPPGVPPLTVRLDGPISAPRRVFDINRLQSYLLGRAGASRGR